MQTRFTPAQLEDPDLREADRILRACVHCGFCLATCPTYLLTGDELESPRGRIYLLKDMLETGRPATPEITRHVDSCLSCLSCQTTCPSGVNYMHLVDMGRARIEETGRRRFADLLVRRLLARVLPRDPLLRAALAAGRLARPLATLLPARLRAALDLLPVAAAAAPDASSFNRPGVFPAEGARRMRVALLSGCVQKTLGPDINAATIRLLTRHGAEVVVPGAAECCGALVHHLGEREAALRSARANVRAWTRAIGEGGLDAVVCNASGCGTMVKDYGFLLRSDPALADKAARISELACDVSELVRELALNAPRPPRKLAVAYLSACSMQHGQRLHEFPMALLAQAGFDLKPIPDPHLCCGSAGTYNVLQPRAAAELGRRKAESIGGVGAQAVATGNIGCMVQIARYTTLPVVHTVELLDWATGGPEPRALASPQGRGTGPAARAPD
jgi:glycolate oxidase iron-sulfur subunit